jgi:hypothetical protein
MYVLTSSFPSRNPLARSPQILNKSVGWVSLWGMVFTYLPGVLICYWQLVTRRPAVRLPGWFKAWMDGRKQLGLLSLFTSEWTFKQQPRYSLAVLLARDIYHHSHWIYE